MTVTVSDGSLSDNEAFTWTVNAVVSNWTATINITGVGVASGSNNYYSVSVPGCSPDSKPEDGAAFSCTATISDSSWVPSIEIDPKRNYCTGSEAMSSSDYTPSVTLTQASPTVSISVEITGNGNGNRRNCTTGPSISYP